MILQSVLPVMPTVRIYNFLLSITLVVCMPSYTFAECQHNCSSDREVSEAFNSQVEFPFRDGISGSPVLLQQLAQKDEKIRKIIMGHFTLNKDGDESKIPQLAGRYLRHYEETVGNMNHTYKPQNLVAFGHKNVAWNPLGVFQLLKRFQKFLMPFTRDLDPTSSHELSLRTKILEDMAELGWPTQDDQRIATSAILRIQLVYDLPTRDLANGIIDGESTGAELSANDCNIIGTQAMMEGSYAFAVEWFEEAVELAASDAKMNEIDPANLELVTSNLELSIAIHDLEFDNSQIWDVRFFYRKIRTSGSNGRLRRRTNELQLWGGGEGMNFGTINYWGLCSGDNYKSEAEKSKLFCYLETKSNPAWSINPLKVELLSIKPLFVVQYHDILSDYMIERIKARAGTALSRSRVFRGSDQVINSARTSFNTWINDHMEDEFSQISRIIGLITGLRVQASTSAEQLQVASYTTGSHYSIHPDSHSLKELQDHHIDKPHGERIATFLFYLSDVQKGGKTAFVHSGVASSPIKGSAVLWFNLMKSTEVDSFTWHGSCPVILGEKWISNKWILAYDQMFHPKFQCTDDPEDIITLDVNGKPLKDFYPSEFES